MNPRAESLKANHASHVYRRNIGSPDRQDKLRTHTRYDAVQRIGVSIVMILNIAMRRACRNHKKKVRRVVSNSGYTTHSHECQGRIKHDNTHFPLPEEFVGPIGTLLLYGCLTLAFFGSVSTGIYLHLACSLLVICVLLVKVVKLERFLRVCKGCDGRQSLFH